MIDRQRKLQQSVLYWKVENADVGRCGEQHAVTMQTYRFKINGNPISSDDDK